MHVNVLASPWISVFDKTFSHHNFSGLYLSGCGMHHTCWFVPYFQVWHPHLLAHPGVCSYHSYYHVPIYRVRCSHPIFTRLHPTTLVPFTTKCLSHALLLVLLYIYLQLLFWNGKKNTNISCTSKRNDCLYKCLLWLNRKCWQLLT